MKRFGNEKPVSVRRRYPGQQYKQASPFALPHHSKPSGFAKRFRKATLPSPADFYEAEIEGFHEGSNGLSLIHI